METTLFSALELLCGQDRSAFFLGATRGCRALYRELKGRGEEERIHGWYDRKYAFYQFCGLPMIEPENLPGGEIDLLIVSSPFGLRANRAVYERLSQKAGKILLLSDHDLSFPDLEWPGVKYTQLPIDPAELLHMDPRDILNENRLDIVVRYRAAKELRDRCGNGPGMQAYRVMMAGLGADEFSRPYTTCGFFSDYHEKIGVESFEQSFIKLVSSMKENGFQRERYVPLSEKGQLLNGAHRVSTAMALGEKVYARVFRGYGEPYLTFGADVLERIGLRNSMGWIWELYHKLKGEAEQ